MSTPLSQGNGPALGRFAGRSELPNLGQDGRLMVKEAHFPRLDMDFVDIKQKSKSFNEGPLIPASPSQNQNGFTDILFKSPDLVDVKKLSLPPRQESFTPGSVKLTGRKGVEEMIENLDKVPSETGVVVVEGFEPTGDQYTEGIHFWKEQRVAKGSFGVGEICIDSKHGNKFFRKKMAKETFRSSEVIVPLNLSHQNLTKFYGLIQREDENKRLTIELMIEPAGSALNIFIQRKELGPSDIVDITKQIMSGLNHMHFYGMIHFDIKPENICIQERELGLLTKITDFGSSKLPQERIEFVGWTPEYTSPESSLFFLQKSGIPIWPKEVTEADITGKHDVFAAALVIMYMYEKVHVLQRLITGGKTTYADFSLEARQLLQMNLMKMLATEPKFLQSMVPDQCDIDMRELLMHMTHYSPEQRCSAQDVISFIDMKEKKKNAVNKERERKLQMRQQEQERVREQEQTFVMSTDDIGENKVPEIAYKCLHTETGPIRMVTKDLLRQKLKPYPMKGKEIHVVAEETPVREMRRLQAARKTADDFQPPPTPVTEMVQSLANLDVKSPVNTTERNSIVTQPEEARHVYRPPVNQSVMVPIIQQARPEVCCNRSTANNRVLPPQPNNVLQSSTTTAVGVEQITQPIPKEVMKEQLKKGFLKVAMTERGPMLVQVQGGTCPFVPNPTGVRPFMPASPEPQDVSIPDLVTNKTGNIPDFMKLC